MYTLILRLKGGANINQIADEVNEDDTKGKGGDLGWFSVGTMAPELERVAFSLQPGLFCTDPLETEYGYHIVALIGRRKLPAVGKVEVHAKHIFMSTKKAMDALSKQAKENVERDIKVVKSKYLVQAPADFTVD
ncbi:MAG: peptidylprolyl isomerase [Acidobacteria bacterium]|nr:peptidylprolyl isomerase [Acidobacteriota bacterium]